jgi:hypothetical protein
MRRSVRPAAIIAIVAGVGMLSIGSRDLEPPGWDRAANAREVARIQEHLSRVEMELRAADVSSFSPTQRANRARNISLLHTYWKAGRFPHNHDFPNQQVLYFADRHGTPCAIAYLIAESGRQDLVDRLVSTNNNGSVFDLAADSRVGPALVSWLDQAGITLDEAARIEPAYSASPL